jgi:xanthine dehydrogenase YagS FAD-binding subunit
MRLFGYARATQPADAVNLVAGRPGATFIAGGTDLLNLMKDGAEAHDLVVDINPLPWRKVDSQAGHLRIGALARMNDVAVHPVVRERLPVLSQALLASASPQLRNMASIGGNLLQRTRCWYFRDSSMPCNKREPGSGCSAIEGQNGRHAILGGSDACIAVHPSDLAVALLALNAAVLTVGPDGERRVPLAELYLLPGSTPDKENALAHGELITGVEIPLTPLAGHSRYLKLRDRASFDFAVVSVAAAVQRNGSTVSDVRLAFGGIGTRPWRSPKAEDALRGKPLTAAAIEAAGRALVYDAKPRQHNAFKVDLVQRALADILGKLGGTR